MPSRASTSFLHGEYWLLMQQFLPYVSMPSRASTSFLRDVHHKLMKYFEECQCPHGLVPHFYEKGDKYVKEAR